MHGHRMHAEGFRCRPARVPLVAELQRSGDVHVMLARSPEMLPFGPLADLNSQTSEQPDCAQLADREPDRSPSLGWSWHITGVQQVAGRVIGPEPSAPLLIAMYERDYRDSGIWVNQICR